MGGVIWAHLVQMGVICHVFGQKGVIYQNIAVLVDLSDLGGSDLARFAHNRSDLHESDEKGSDLSSLAQIRPDLPKSAKKRG